MPQSSLKMTESKYTQRCSSWCSIINSFAGKVHCQPTPVPPSAKHSSQQPQGHQCHVPIGPLVSLPPPSEQGCTRASRALVSGITRLQRLIPLIPKGIFNSPLLPARSKSCYASPHRSQKHTQKFKKVFCFQEIIFLCPSSPPSPPLKLQISQIPVKTQDLQPTD